MKNNKKIWIIILVIIIIVIAGNIYYVIYKSNRSFKIKTSDYLLIKPADIILDSKNNNLAIENKDMCIESALKIIEDNFKNVSYQYTDFYYNPIDNSCFAKIGIYYPDSINNCHSASMVIDVKNNKEILIICNSAPTSKIFSNYFYNNNTGLKKINKKEYDNKILSLKEILTTTQGVGGTVFPKPSNPLLYNSSRVYFTPINENNKSILTEGLGSIDGYGNYSNVNLLPGLYEYSVSNDTKQFKIGYFGCKEKSKCIINIEKNTYTTLNIDLNNLEKLH